MPQTVFITGASSGIGRVTARYFLQKGWNVVASMRDPSREKEFHNSSTLLLLSVDVTKPQTIQKAMQEAVDKFGRIDVLVNNAGFGFEGPFESFSESETRELFDTNFFGLLSAVRCILSIMKRQKSGTIINISSMGGRLTFPFYTMYHASKWAVEGFSESLQYELAPLGIKVKLIEPGLIKTNFYDTMGLRSKKSQDPMYTVRHDVVNKRKQVVRKFASDPIIVAKAIYKAATDQSSRLRYIVGLDALAQIIARKIVPESWIFGLIKRFS